MVARGMKQVWRPHVRIWGLSEAKCTVLKKVLATLLGFLAPPQWFSAPIVIRCPGNFAPLAPLRYDPVYFILTWFDLCSLRNCFLLVLHVSHLLLRQLITGSKKKISGWKKYIRFYILLFGPISEWHKFHQQHRRRGKSLICGNSLFR